MFCVLSSVVPNDSRENVFTIKHINELREAMHIF